MSPAELLGLATRVASSAAALVAEGRTAALADPANIATKSAAADFVTVMDRAAERHIRELLAEARPGDAIVGEEYGGDDATPGALRWIVDPIDGTTNYVHGHPMWCVSVAVWDDEGPLAGCVAQPTLGRVFAAARDTPTTLNGVPVACSRPTERRRLLLATGFSYSPELRVRQMRELSTFIGEIGDIRRGGSAALDLCSVACGEVDAYVEGPLSVWDYAAGCLIAEMAGAECRRAVDDTGGALIVAGSEEALGLLDADNRYPAATRLGGGRPIAVGGDGASRAVGGDGTSGGQ